MENTITLPATSRVWIYMADRAFTNEETTLVSQLAEDFVQQWAAHGKSLLASAEVKYNRFIVLTVDESQAGASGCSIDSSVHFIKELGNKLNIDFFNRLLMAYKDSANEIQTIHQSKLSELYTSGEVSDETLVFNNMVASKAALDAQWEVALKDSFYKRLV